MDLNNEENTDHPNTNVNLLPFLFPHVVVVLLTKKGLFVLVSNIFFFEAEARPICPKSKSLSHGRKMNVQLELFHMSFIFG